MTKAYMEILWKTKVFLMALSYSMSNPHRDDKDQQLWMETILTTCPDSHDRQQHQLTNTLKPTANNYGVP